jgi:pteridine reductase
MTGKVVMVTGGARRVGRAIVLGFAQAGADVVIHHSSSDKAALKTAREAEAFGVRALVVKGNYAHVSSINRNFERVRAEFGRLDVLVNNASSFDQIPFLELRPDQWQAAMDLNLNAPFYTTQRAAQLMIEQKIAGSILNICDNSAYRPWFSRPSHSVSKAGLLALTHAAARSLAPYRIRVNALVLGPILPAAEHSDALWQKVEARLPLKRSGDLREIADAALMIANNAFMTGADVRLDGGEWLGDATHDPQPDA